jgi:aryl-alcohol dehydrogenase-like predicted oxidoreductase
MEYARLGQTGVEVSRLGLGGASAGLANYLKFIYHRYPNATKIIHIDECLC